METLISLGIPFSPIYKRSCELRGLTTGTGDDTYTHTYTRSRARTHTHTHRHTHTHTDTVVSWMFCAHMQ